MVRFGLALLAATLLVGAGGKPTLPEASQNGLINLVRHDCGSCHGITLKGGLGPALLPENLTGKSEDTLTAVVLDGLAGTPMPPWRGLLSEEEVRWIIRYLKMGAKP